MALSDLFNLRKQAPSTTLVSGGTDVPPEAEAEIGSSRATIIREVVPDLVSKTMELRTYYQMANFHSACRSSLKAVKSSVMGAEYYVEPADEDQESLDIAEFVEYNLTAAPSSPWRVTLSRILKMCDYGVSCFEHVWEQRDWAPNRPGANHKTYTMLKKLAPRPASTIEQIFYDENGGPTGIRQYAVRDQGGGYDQVEIPIEKLLLFVNDEDNGDLWGRSLLRSAYPHWFYIQHLYKVDAIQKERHGIGVPFGQLPPGYTDADRDAAFEMVSNLRTNERSGVVYPEGYVFGFLEVKGHMANVIESVDHHNSMIMLNVLAEFLMSGMMHTGGGRATSASQQDIFMKANRSMADMICDTFNLYLVPYIVGYNFSTDKYPIVKARNIGDTKDQQQLASALANLFAQEVITPDEDTENWARRAFDMPRKIGPRPVLSPSQIREVINVQGGGNGQVQDTTQQKGNIKPNANKPGNMGKGNNVT